MSDKDHRDKIQEASDNAMIRHLDGTPNDELRELVRDFRVDIDGIEDGDYDEHMAEAERDGYVEGLATVCNALEELVGQ
jgi:hypothetical protein